MMNRIHNRIFSVTWEPGKLSSVLWMMVCGLLLLPACQNDDNDMHEMDEFEYQIQIHSPDNSAKNLGDTLNIDVVFESQTGNTVHHIQVRIFNRSTLNEAYRQPTDPHVHQTDGLYQFTGAFVLSGANGVTADSNWVLEAKVWGHDEGVSEVAETVEFQVIP